MKKAIIIPITLRLNQPEESSYFEGLRLAKRAIENMEKLEGRAHLLLSRT